MKVTQLIFAGCILFLFFSCQPSIKQENDLLLKDILAAHDSIMPMVGTFTLSADKIDTLIQKLTQHQQDMHLDTVTQKQILWSLKTELNTATDSMNSWMAHFDHELKGKNEQQIHAYLSAEQTKINRLKTQFKKVELQRMQILK